MAKNNDTRFHNYIWLHLSTRKQLKTIADVPIQPIALLAQTWMLWTKCP
jgi:hypothetical protein